MRAAHKRAQRGCIKGQSNNWTWELFTNALRGA
jgi:hypothetical protein